jgi:hypothetical protein
VPTKKQVHLWIVKGALSISLALEVDLKGTEETLEVIFLRVIRIWSNSLALLSFLLVVAVLKEMQGLPDLIFLEMKTKTILVMDLPKEVALKGLLVLQEVISLALTIVSMPQRTSSNRMFKAYTAR